MPKKAKRKTFSSVKAVKAAAREKVGSPPPTRSVPDAKTKARQRQGKYKPTLGRLLSEE